MNAKDAIRSSLEMSRSILTAYISDLSDQELMTRPGPGCNHIAWQLGHLIISERGLLEAVSPGSAPALPDGFEKAYSRETPCTDNAKEFCSKATYVELLDKLKDASLKALEKFPDASMDEPGPESMRDYAATKGDVFNLIATHPLMHAGQFVPVRRALGKPVVI